MRALHWVAVAWWWTAGVAFAPPPPCPPPALGARVLRAASVALESPALAEAAALPPQKKLRVAVLLLNLGGPETSSDVEPFLYNLFADPDIIRLPPAVSGVQTALAWLIAKRRAPQSRAAYDAIGGGSPIKKFTVAQAELLEAELNRGASC